MTLKLLVADDSVTIQKMVRLAFGAEDAEVEAVTSGEAALEALRRFRPDIVLADALMPGIGGYELCARIREEPEFSRLPVILLSGTFEPFDPQEAERVGADGHLSKPFDTSELIDRVHSLAGAAAPAAGPGLAAVRGNLASARESFLGPGAILDLFGPDRPGRGGGGSGRAPGRADGRGGPACGRGGRRAPVTRRDSRGRLGSRARTGRGSPAARHRGARPRERSLLD
jgi:CheY-like chemotaxis protein